MKPRDFSRPHLADKPILRDFFWFLVLPHRFGQWLRATESRGAVKGKE